MNVDDLYREIEREALGPINRFYAWKALGHPPSSLECIDHFLKHGGEEYVRKKMGIPEWHIDEICDMSVAS
jgi:hypothetical protein